MSKSGKPSGSLRKQCVPQSNCFAMKQTLCLLFTLCVLSNAIDATTSWTAGASDENGKRMSGTEILKLASHQGKLFAATSLWMETDRSLDGCQVLVKESTDSDWKVDLDMSANHTRMTALQSFKFRSDHRGEPIEPVTMLLAAPLSRRGIVSIWARQDESGDWLEFPLGNSRTTSQVRGMGFHRDTVTGADMVFAGVSGTKNAEASLGMLTATYDANAQGKLVWSRKPELMLPKGQRFMEYAVCNGKLYASSTKDIWVREDGKNPKWKSVYQNARMTSGGGIRGLVTVPAPSGNKEALLFITNGVARTLDPNRNNVVRKELDIAAFLAKEWNLPIDGSLAGYNKIVHDIGPDGQDRWCIGFQCSYDKNYVENGGMEERNIRIRDDGRRPIRYFASERNFLIRSLKKREPVYTVRSFEAAGKGTSGAVRSIVRSPFEGEENTLYLGGGECNGMPSHDTGWIYAVSANLTHSATATASPVAASVKVLGKQTKLVKASDDRPNIILILADDLGYADVGVNGCQDVPTPRIDSIATNGVRFTHGYANHPVCSPSRAGLMTGMYQHRFGFERNSGPERYAAANFGVPRRIPLLSEKLNGVGYATGMIGKWHIGFREGLRPHERGFDFTYVFHSGARSYYPKTKNGDPLYRNGIRVAKEPAYLTDAFAEESANFIKQNRNDPFFLYLAFNAVHTPMEATNKYLKRFPNIKDRKRKAMAGMLSAMDDAVGDILDTLETLNLAENTLIMFYSDNGGIPPLNASQNHPFRGMKGTLYEGGIRVPFLFQWPDAIPAGSLYENPVMGFDCHATALSAAGLSDTTATAIDGVDLLPFLKGEQSRVPHEELFWRSGPKHALRMGDWKLVNERTGGQVLFNLKEDPQESANLSAQHPSVFREMKARYQTWSRSMMRPQWIRQDQNNAYPGGELKSKPQNSQRKKNLKRDIPASN